MLTFVIGIVIAFHVASCQALNSEPQSKPNHGESVAKHGSQDQIRTHDTAALFVPGETDIVKIRSFVLAQRLERTTKFSDTWGEGFHAETPYRSAEEEQLDKNFLISLRNGEYAKIDQFIGQYTSLLPQDPSVTPSPRVLARLGFLNVWKFAERYRLLPKGGSFEPAAGQEVLVSLESCAQYFTRASETDQKNSIYRGFAADCNLAMAETPNGEKFGMTGLSLASQAIRRNPEFNLFTVGYILSSLPIDRPEFNLGLEMMWKNLDVCFNTKIDRNNPDVSSFMQTFLPIGHKRFCLNSEIAPQNFEGFFMIFGDLLVKAGKPAVAKVMYANAKLLPSFHTWSMRDKLLEKIATADQNVAAFKLPVSPTTRPNFETITFHTEKSCMVCHQK